MFRRRRDLPSLGHCSLKKVLFNLFKAIPTAERKETRQKLEELKNKMEDEINVPVVVHPLPAHVVEEITGGATSSLAATISSNISENDFINSPLDKLTKSKGR